MTGHSGKTGAGRLLLGAAALLCAALMGQPALAQGADNGPIVLRTMGSLFFGGTVTTLENGIAFHGDHDENAGQQVSEELQICLFP